MRIFTDCKRCVNCGRKITSEKDALKNEHGEWPWAVHLDCFNRTTSYYLHPISESRAEILDYVYRLEKRLVDWVQ